MQTPNSMLLYVLGWWSIVWYISRRLQQLEYGSRVIDPGFSCFFCFGIRGRSYSNFLASTVGLGSAAGRIGIGFRSISSLPLQDMGVSPKIRGPSMNQKSRALIVRTPAKTRSQICSNSVMSRSQFRKTFHRSCCG